MEPTLALATKGDNKTQAPFKSGFWSVYDTIFWNCASQLTDQDLFTNGNKDIQYKSNDFPSNSQAFDILGMEVSLDWKFDGSTKALREWQLAHALKHSMIIIKLENEDMYKFALKDLVNYELLPNPAADATDAHVTVRSKISNYFQFPNILEIGAGKLLEVQFRAAKGLSFAAKDATNKNNPVHPNAGLTDDIGYSLRVDFRTNKFKKS